MRDVPFSTTYASDLPQDTKDFDHTQRVRIYM